MYRETVFPGGRKLERLVEDRSVSSLEWYEVPLRIGQIPIRCGGIGMVGTLPAERGKGYARELFHHTLDRMWQERCPITILFGIPDLYHKFGYAPALVECESSIATRNAEMAQARYMPREYRPADAPSVAAMCNSVQAQRNVAVERDIAAWSGFKWGPHWSYRLGAFVIEDQNNLVGYACYDLDPTRCVVGEVGYVHRGVFSSILAHLASIAVARRVETIRLYLPPDDPFVEFCHRFGCATQVTYPYSEHGMARVVDQTALLEALRPLFDARLERAGLADAIGELQVETDLGCVCLPVGAGSRVIRLAVPQQVLAQLILGFRSVADALVDQYGPVSEAAILETLLPVSYPCIWASDRF